MLLTSKIIGIDIGGTKIHIGLLKNGIVLESVKLETPYGETQEGVIGQLIAGIECLAGYKEAIGIGVGAPGLINEEKGIIFSVNNISSWKEVHLRDALSRHFHKPVFLTNDANCFAIGVKLYGEGKKYTNLVGLSLGTGVGAGLILNGYLYSGQVAGAGELGGIPYEEADFETYCSGKFFLKFYGISGVEAYRRALIDDRKAIQMFEEFGHHVGNLIKQIVFVLAPEAVIIGGSVGESFHFWQESMWKTIQTFPYSRALENFAVEASTVSKMAVIGAAALFQNRFEKENQNLNVD